MGKSGGRMPRKSSRLSWGSSVSLRFKMGSFSEFYVKTPSKTRPGEEEQTNRDIQLTLSNLKQRMMQMESHMVSDGEVASRLQNGNSTMDAGHKFEQTARASSDIGNLIARYQQLRANAQEVTSNENGQLRVPNTPPNSHTDSRSPVGLSPLNSTGTPSSTLSTPSKPPQPTTITAADHAIRGNSFSELEVSSWPTSRMERRVDRGSDHASVATAPADLSDRYNYDSLISLSESLREKTAALRDNATRQAEHSNVSHSSLLLDDDFNDIQEQLQNMSPYSRSPSPGRLSAGGPRNQTAYKRPELTIGLSATPMSPLMSSLHQVDGLGADDILDEHDSILLPTSPPADNPTSPNTGCLIDLSF
ncbi:hypothetical protein LSAT2_024990 [Lamellibrachia satsuma]|nr:hypothetical protein LSAT2_024990 [Lamellibrachia satsuma]